MKITIADEFYAEEVLDRAKDIIEREQRIIVRNAAERFKERVLLRLSQRKALNTPEMRDIVITTGKTFDGWRSTVKVDKRVVYLERGTSPHYIKNTPRTRAYADHYGLSFVEFRGGIARKGTKAKPIFDFARTLAERQMERDIMQVLDKV